MNRTDIGDFETRLREHLDEVTRTKQPLHVESGPDAELVVVLDPESFAELSRLAEQARLAEEGTALLEAYQSAMKHSRPAAEVFAELRADTERG